MQLESIKSYKLRDPEIGKEFMMLIDKRLNGVKYFKSTIIDVAK